MSPSSPAERSAAAEVIALDTPNLGDRSYVVGVDGLAVVVDPQRDIDRVLDLVAEPRVADHPRPRDARPQRLRDRRARAGPRHRRGLRDARRGRVRTSTATPDERRRHVFPAETRRATLAPGPAHPRAHAAPPVVRAVGRRRRRRGVHRRLDAARQRGPPRPARPRPSPTGSPTTSGTRCAGSPRRSPAARRSSRPTGSAPSARHRHHRHRLDGRRPDRPATRRAPWTRTSSSTELLAGLDAFPAYYAHMGPANAAGPGPIDLIAARAAPTPPSCVAGSRPANGSSTCARAASSPTATCAGTLSFDGYGNAVTYLGWTDPVGHPGDPAGEHGRRGHRLPARAGADRDRPTRLVRHRRTRRLGHGPRRPVVVPGHSTSPAWPRR